MDRVYPFLSFRKRTYIYVHEGGKKTKETYEVGHKHFRFVATAMNRKEFSVRKYTGDHDSRTKFSLFRPCFSTKKTQSVKNEEKNPM